jgi:RNA polymerase sigma-70 factor (ECF subfamily)
MPNAEAGGFDDLVRAAGRGERDAFARLVLLHQSLVYGLAWNSLRNQAFAEELAQEVFMQLHSELPRLESNAHVVNWLRRVTINRCIDHVRRERKRPKVGLDEISEPSAAPDRDGNSDPFLTERLRVLTASLPARARAVLLLRYQEELDPPEIARILEIPVNTVKSQLHRSLALLRSKLVRARVTT